MPLTPIDDQQSLLPLPPVFRPRHGSCRAASTAARGWPTVPRNNPMLETAVIATDLTDDSDRIFANLNGLRSLGTRRLVLTHVASASLESSSGEEQKRIMDRLASQANILGGEGFAVTIRLCDGNPAQRLTEAALSEEASLMVLGSLGKSITSQLILGSTVQDVLKIASIPVLMMKPQPDNSSGRRHYRLALRDLSRHILFGADFSPTSESAFQFLRALAPVLQGKITLLHCHTGNTPVSKSKEDPLRQLLQEMRDSLEKTSSRPVETILINSHDPADAIIKTASLPSVSLILLGTRGKGAVRELLIGGVSHKVARQAEVPLLLIPPNFQMESASTTGPNSSRMPNP